ncbi:MAG: cupin domain-containing protein [Ectothiorhodospiraceae bacterium]|nr:cupin domain-containing protein [Ectothiorhodospiraceae bacterium]MCH8503430.1 cupin domain-containing protein [Ectothiorhodospiraceae bacterium]
MNAIQRQSTMTAVAGTAFAATLALSGLAHADDNPTPIHAEPLSERTTFTDDVGFEIRLRPDGREQEVVTIDDPSRIAMFKFTIQPGAYFPWHTHPGLAVASMQQGELVYIYADDCVERPYPTGTTFIDPGGDNVHTAYNPGDAEEAIVMVTFIGAPAEGSLTEPANEEESARLDERCGIER